MTTPRPPLSREAALEVGRQEDECCAGCGDANPEFFWHGEPCCYSCASCDICQSPYCEDPSHE